MTKILKTAEKAENNGSSHEDLISRLPDEILTHILSFIPTKSAIETSLLSKRWEHVWISVPNLDSHCSAKSNSINFASFVDRVLSANNVLSLHKIDLSYPCDIEIPRVNAWSSNIVERNAKEIRLESQIISWNNYISSWIPPLPGSFFNQKNLVRLELKNIALIIPTFVSFPSLKTIYLTSVRLLDDDSMINLLNGCRVLRSLLLDRDKYDSIHTLYICSSTLTNLRLTKSDYALDDSRFVIDAPNLVDVFLSKRIGMDFDMINVHSLVSAYISVEGYRHELFEHLTKISHVEKLHISYTETVNHFFIPSPLPVPMMPIFQSLNHLEVIRSPKDTWAILPCLLHCTPNLKTLVLDLCNNDWRDPNEVPGCFLACIETVVIKTFCGHAQEMRVISYILKNAMVLKKLSIHGSASTLVQLQVGKIHRSLFVLQKSDVACRVEYEGELCM